MCKRILRSRGCRSITNQSTVGVVGGVGAVSSVANHGACKVGIRRISPVHYNVAITRGGSEIGDISGWGYIQVRTVSYNQFTQKFLEVKWVNFPCLALSLSQNRTICQEERFDPKLALINNRTHQVAVSAESLQSANPAWSSASHASCNNTKPPKKLGPPLRRFIPPLEKQLHFRYRIVRLMASLGICY